MGTGTGNTQVPGSDIPYSRPNYCCSGLQGVRINNSGHGIGRIMKSLINSKVRARRMQKRRRKEREKGNPSV
jgi:hypothetical protein